MFSALESNKEYTMFVTRKTIAFMSWLATGCQRKDFISVIILCNVKGIKVME